MTRRTFGVLGTSFCCVAGQLVAQQSDVPPLAESFADSIEIAELPIHPQPGERLIDAPFYAYLRAEVFGQEPTIGEFRLWRRSDGSTRKSSGVKPFGRFGPTLAATVIEDYEAGVGTAFLTLAGVRLPSYGVKEEALSRAKHFASGQELVTHYWDLREESSVVVAGVPCRRRILLSPQRERTMEVCFAEDLQIVTREILKRGDGLLHVYEAEVIELDEPEPTVFRPPR